MADRLAAARARQGGGYQNDSYGGYGGSGGASDAGGGYQSRPPNPYARQDDNNTNRYEMTAVNTSSDPINGNSGYGAATGGGVDMNAFWNEVTDVQKPPALVQRQCQPHRGTTHALVEQHWRPRRAAAD